ncbi:hypothetical protein HZA86_04955 [Candidatus Uhrbacteria bacterium]|nr:hypothetical protein [Candidatus Uhrbacteria bacterium]
MGAEMPQSLPEQEITDRIKEFTRGMAPLVGSPESIAEHSTEIQGLLDRFQGLIIQMESDAVLMSKPYGPTLLDSAKTARRGYVETLNKAV